MIKAAIEKIASMAENKTHEIDGRTYSEKGLVLIEEPRYKPTHVVVKGIDSLVNLIKQEIERLNAPVFVEVVNYNEIKTYSTYDERFERQELYRAVSDVPQFQFGWREYNEAMIAFRSQFIQGEGTEYVLDLLSKITDENKVSSEDNGLSQTVEVRKGIGLKAKENIKPIVKLTPYRTFLEIEQPESEFLLRLDENGRIGLFEADGGMWKLEAKKRIANELNWKLMDLRGDGKVIVMF
ncbi:MAG: hypothetical protein PHE79_08660 [Eubacteriales bacterium]|nr:hypothetical protein [Eubacteriales bacterium]